MFRARAGHRPPHVVEIAFRLSFLVVLIDAGGWVLDTFFVPPTGFRELRDQLGWSGAVQQAAVSAGALVVLGAAMLLCAFWMRQGRNWARLVLIALGALYLAFMLTDMNMDGLGVEAVYRYLPELCTAAIAALLLLPASRAYFSPARQTS
ncbi:hypothetical protein [Streptomyces angustmyceticus]|uniref:hypothetical protein n=1 Tax=Streptomyces angustmyceticus TaxID=285578 RepID=UPI003D927C14